MENIVATTAESHTGLPDGSCLCICQAVYVACTEAKRQYDEIGIIGLWEEINNLAFKKDVVLDMRLHDGKIGGLLSMLRFIVRKAENKHMEEEL